MLLHRAPSRASSAMRAKPDVPQRLVRANSRPEYKRGRNAPSQHRIREFEPYAGFGFAGLGFEAGAIGCALGRNVALDEFDDSHLARRRRDGSRPS